jgi:hypothetical protein
MLDTEHDKKLEYFVYVENGYGLEFQTKEEVIEKLKSADYDHEYIATLKKWLDTANNGDFISIGVYEIVKASGRNSWNREES